MEALGQLTGGVAHDFNNLLMVVSGQAQLLRRKVGDDPKAQRALDAIEMSAQRGEDLTRHLLSFARRQRLRPEPVAMHERAHGLRELLSAGLPPGVQLMVDLSARLWPVEADVGELELALLNLTVNARDAMPNGGAVTITGQNVTLTPGGEPMGLAGDFVALSVSDTGVGIPADILPRVFDPFFTTKEVSKGTGLGLSQVYGFAQQSAGQVVVSSELNRGSTFTLYLPRALSEPGAKPAGVTPEAVGGIDILLVEDNPEVAEVAAGMLEQLGHKVRVASSAAAAMAVLNDGDRPDLVFSDIVMAGEMDGLGLARRLREEAPGLPVLLATGYSQAAERLGDEFQILRKPYKMSDLNGAIGEALASGRSEGKLVRIETARRARSRKDRAS
jgi:CheY-like chemotaxis protein